MPQPQTEWLAYHYTTGTHDWTQWRITLPENGYTVNLIARPHHLHLTSKILWESLPTQPREHLAANGSAITLIHHINVTTDNLHRFIKSHLDDCTTLIGRPLHKVSFKATHRTTPNLKVQATECNPTLLLTSAEVESYEQFLAHAAHLNLPIKEKRKLYVTAKRILDGFPAALRKNTPLRGLKYSPHPVVKSTLK